MSCNNQPIARAVGQKWCLTGLLERDNAGELVLRFGAQVAATFLAEAPKVGSMVQCYDHPPQECGNIDRYGVMGGRFRCCDIRVLTGEETAAWVAEQEKKRVEKAAADKLLHLAQLAEDASVEELTELLSAKLRERAAEK